MSLFKAEKKKWRIKEEKNQGEKERERK
jgi:hypothetical protein